MTKKEKEMSKMLWFQRDQKWKRECFCKDCGLYFTAKTGKNLNKKLFKQVLSLRRNSLMSFQRIFRNKDKKR